MYLKWLIKRIFLMNIVQINAMYQPVILVDFSWSLATIKDQ